MATFTVNLTGYTATGTQIRWDDNVGLPATFDLGGNTQTLSQVILRTTGAVRLSILGTNRRFTPEFEATGRIIFAASDGELLEVMIANADMTEAYEWTPTNSAEVIAFITHVRTLADNNATLTLTDDADTNAPVFADNTGDAQTWTQNVAITQFMVPVATGTPAPTYAVVGALPDGIIFGNLIRVISGTPTEVGAGTITIRATNSEGFADWTFDYTTTAGGGGLLSLADFDQTGITVDFAGLIIAGSDAQSGGTAIYVSDAAGVPWTDTGALIDGNLDYDGATAALTRVMFTTSAIRFNDNQTGDTGDLDAFMSMPGMSIFLTVDDGGSVVTHESGYTPGGTGGNYYNFTFDDAATDTAFRALAVGDRFVFAMGTPPPPPADYAVDAGDVAWEFTLPQPTETHIQAGNQPPVVTITTQPMTVDGGDDVSIQATATDPDGTVNSVVWGGGGTFNPPNALNTVWTAPAGLGGEAGYALALTATDDSGATGQGFVQMTVRAAEVLAANAGDAAFAFTIPEAAVTLTLPLQISIAEANVSADAAHVVSLAVNVDQGAPDTYAWAQMSGTYRRHRQRQPSHCLDTRAARIHGQHVGIPLHGYGHQRNCSRRWTAPLQLPHALRFKRKRARAQPTRCPPVRTPTGSCPAANYGITGPVVRLPGQTPRTITTYSRTDGRRHWTAARCQPGTCCGCAPHC